MTAVGAWKFCTRCAEEGEDPYFWDGTGSLSELPAIDFKAARENEEFCHSHSVPNYAIDEQTQTW